MRQEAPFDRPLPPIEAYGESLRTAPQQRPPKPSMTLELEWFDSVSPVLTSLYLIKEVLDRGTMSCVYGASGSGKTFFTLDLAYHIAAGIPWRGHRVSSGTVVYLAAEGGRGTLNRMAALRSTYGEQAVPLAVRRAGLDLLHPDADVQRVIDMMKEVGQVALIVVDTLSRVLAGGDENGPVDMTAFVANCDRIREETGAHILIVHHSGKEAARGARGHSSLKAALDTEIEITADGAGNRTVTVHKQRDLPSGKVFHFTLTSVEIGVDQDGDPVRSCIVEAGEQQQAPTSRKNLAPADQVALNALDDALQEYGTKRSGPDWPLNVPVVNVERWREHFYRHCDEDDEQGAKKKAFQRTRKRLRDNGHIQFFDNHYWRRYD